MENKIYKIIDSVDIFLSNNKYLVVYFMNTRQRMSFKVNGKMVNLLELIDGHRTMANLLEVAKEKYGIPDNDVKRALELLEKHHIITAVYQGPEILSDRDRQRYDRQINYFTEMLGDEYKGIYAQKKLLTSRILVLGCGAIGGDIAIQMAMAGVRHITLYDDDLVDESDVSRHMYYSHDYLGMPKVQALKNEIMRIDHEAVVTSISQYLCPSTQIEDLIVAHDFVIDTLDEPYIGYTAAKISRICVKHNIPHFIGGGFDAHLASTGELIIPHVTPCAECYADYFKVKLKDWKPKKHPVKVRYMEIGGLASMSLFSSSFASTEIIKYLAGLVDMEKSYKIRGELLFHDLALTYLDVKRNPSCPVCGGKNHDA